MGKHIERRKGLIEQSAEYNNKKTISKRNKELEENPIQLEKNDTKALLLSSFMVIFVPTLLILGLIVIVALLVFRII